MVNKNHAIIKELVEMGFDENQATRALEKCDYNKERALELILTGVDSDSQAVVPYNPAPSPATVVKSDEDDMKKAIEMSLKEASLKNYYSDQKERDPGIPVGLKNSSNIGFFTSLIQLYYSIPAFKTLIENLPIISSTEDPRKKKLISLVAELKQLFMLLDTSKFKYEDVTGLVQALIDIDGIQAINSEKNQVSEFSMKFIARLEEGLQSLNSQEEGPVKKDSINFFTDNSILAKLFYGKFFTLSSGVGPDGKFKKEGNKNVFGKIDVEVDHKDLYEAWHAAFKKNVDKFPVTSTTSVKAKQTSWIDVLPPVLVFEINRLALDANGNTIKLKKPFEFPKTLHPGRFLAANRAESSKLQKNMAKRKKQIKNLKSTINRYLKFNGSDFSILNMLKLCSEFLHTQEDPEVLGKKEELVVFTPSAVHKEADHKVCTSLIDNYVTQVDNEVSQYQNELDCCVNEIENIFDRESLNKFTYGLKAIFIHNGQVGGGQYYAFIYDGGMWKKYHDTNVSVVSEKEVMFDSIGEYGISAACCLVYVDLEYLEKDREIRNK